jgi:2-methylcitrate dehydratase
MLPKPALLLVGEPETAKRAPKTAVDAQFSVHYATLTALATGHADPEDFLDPESFVKRHPEINDIQVSASPECDALFPQHWAAHLFLETREGNRTEKFVIDPKGSRYNPLSWEEIISRFRRLSAVLSEPVQNELIAACRNLKNSPVHPYSLLKHPELALA